MNLQEIQDTIHKLNKDIEECKGIVSRNTKLINAREKTLKVLKEKLEKIQGNDFAVTDHALVRYFERVKGVNVDEIKASILSENTKQLIIKLGDGTFPNNGFDVVVKNKQVITIITP